MLSVTDRSLRIVIPARWADHVPGDGPVYHDFYCGAGGSSIGLTRAGFRLAFAGNHNPVCIETHGQNFPYAEHKCADLTGYPMRVLPRAKVLWASPICTEVSPAGGNRRERDHPDQAELEEHGKVTKDDYARTRVTFHEVFRAAEVWQYDAVIVENVVDVVTKWKHFDWWVEGMKMIGPGYNVQFVSVSSAHVGGEDNVHAPQWRDRLYVVFTKAGIPLPDVAPRPLAHCAECGADVEAVQWWKPRRLTRKQRTQWRSRYADRVGKYGRNGQYLYRCPNASCQNALVEPYIRPAASIVDWADLGIPIGERHLHKLKPLELTTMRRIRAGVAMFGSDPVAVAVAGNTYERPGSGYYRVRAVASSPLTTRTATSGDALVCPPFTVHANHDDGGRHALLDEAPLPARTAKIGDGIAVPPGAFIDVMRQNCGAASLTDPLATLAAQGNHHALAVPAGSFVVKNYSAPNPRHRVQSVTAPLGAITGSDHHGLVVPYYRTGRAKPTRAPLDTLTSKPRFGLLNLTGADLDGIDISHLRYRMFKPPEHLAAQCFPPMAQYHVAGNIGQQTMQAGQAVSCNVAYWLGMQLRKVLG